MSDMGELFVALKVDDAQESAEFYRKLGFTPVSEDRWNSDYALFRYGGTTIALMTFIPQTVLLNLEQTDQAAVDALGERLKEQGLPVITAGREGKGFYVDDPHGGGVYIFTEASG